MAAYSTNRNIPSVSSACGKISPKKWASMALRDQLPLDLVDAQKYRFRTPNPDLHRVLKALHRFEAHFGTLTDAASPGSRHSSPVTALFSFMVRAHACIAVRSQAPLFWDRKLL